MDVSLGAAIFSLDFWIPVGVLAGVYTIFTLGLQLQYGFTGLLNFGHVAFMAIGAYTSALIIFHLDPTITIPFGLFSWTVPQTMYASLAGIAVAMLFGLLISLPAIRLRTDYLAITTIAFSEIIRILINNLRALTHGDQGVFGFAKDVTGLSRKVSDVVPDIGPIEVNKNFVLFVLVWLVVIILFVFLQRVVRSPWGRVLRAIREDEDAANALGKNPFAYKLQVMAIGSAIGAIAGVFHSWHLLFLNPGQFIPQVTFFAYVILLLGGVARNIGIPLGAIIFTAIFAGTRSLTFWPLSLLSSADRAAVRLIIVGSILIGLMAFRPQGLLGNREELLLDR